MHKENEGVCPRGGVTSCDPCVQGQCGHTVEMEEYHHVTLVYKDDEGVLGKKE